MKFLEQLQELIDKYQDRYNKIFGKLTFSQIDDMEEPDKTDMIQLEEDITMLKYIRDLYEDYLLTADSYIRSKHGKRR